MDLGIIAQALEGIKQFATDYQAYLGGFAGILLAVYAFYQKYQVIIGRIVLRIQKDTADGTWTDEEKEQAAVDIYFNEVLPALPVTLILLKLLLGRRFIMEPLIRKIVRAICKKTANIKKVK